jgi:serine/threonine protein phosphatase PrpC
MMCTDGLHGAVPDEIIRETLEAERDLERAAERLIDTALARHGRDNVTVLLARYTA